MMKFSWKVRTWLILTLLCGNLLVFAFSWYSLHRSRQQYEQSAQTLSRNIARAVNQEVSDGVEKINLALHTLTDELEDQLAENGIDEKVMRVYMTRHEQRMPQIEAFRVSNAAGQVILGKGLDKQKPVNIIDRDYFLYHQDHASGNLFITKPILSRILHRDVIIIAKRYNYPDGRFAGVVHAVVSVEHFRKMLSRFTISPNDALVLRDADLGLIARYPPLPDQPGGRVGDNNVSAELQRLVKSGVQSSTYHARVNSDGIDRTITFQRLSSAPMMVLVGLSSEDYFANWKKETRMTLSVALGFFMISVLLGWYIQKLFSQAIAREKVLADRNAAYQSVLTTTLDGYLSLDDHGQVQDTNLTYCQLSGFTREELLGMNINDLSAIESTQGTLEHIRHIIETGKDQFESIHRRKDGSLWNVEVSTTYRDVKGGQFFVFLRDITARKQAETNLRIAATVFESHEGMTVTDAQQIILRVNRAFTEITGYTATEVLGQTLQLLKSNRHDEDFFGAVWNSVVQTGLWQGEILSKRKNGDEYPEWLSISAVGDSTGATTHYVGIFSDITERKAAAENIQQLSFYDHLTQLPNRRLLIDRLQQALAASARHQHQCALLQIDVDDFKSLNDTLGHDKGDLLLQLVAQRLSACMRDGDTVARLGGDKFIVLMEDLSKTPHDAATQAEAVGEKILATLNLPYPLGNAEHHRSASIGITLLDGAQLKGIEEPLKWAELAMYQAKIAGRNTLRFFDPQMQAVVNARVAMEASLHEALVKHQFTLYYQAQVDGNYQITGVEALIRWTDPLRGMVPPAEFIPLAEGTGLILPIGQWVLETACKQLALWANNPEMAHLTIAVNVSARQFHQDNFVDQVFKTLKRTGAQASRLKLELTESLLITIIETVIGKMNALKGIGINFSLDDFGTGYSSLTYLKRLPLSQLKIDQGFVRNILIDSNDAAIAKMVIALADSMALEVIAEGVETQAQSDFLASIGCHAFQGYRFSRPLPIAEFEKFAKSNSSNIRQQLRVDTVSLSDQES